MTRVGRYWVGKQQDDAKVNREASPQLCSFQVQHFRQSEYASLYLK